MNISESVCLVTGAAKRVGRAIALEFARRGAIVVVHFRHSKQEAAATARECSALSGRDALPLYANLADPAEVEDMARDALAAYGRVDVLVNNASIFTKKPLLETSSAEWDQVFATNLRGPAWLSRALAPAMLERKQGLIINIADTLAQSPRAGYLPYSASKAALIALTQGMAREFAPHIRVNAVCPGIVLPRAAAAESDAAFAKKTSLLERPGTPEELAAACAFLAENDYVNGICLNLDGGAG